MRKNCITDVHFWYKNAVISYTVHPIVTKDSWYTTETVTSDDTSNKAGKKSTILVHLEQRKQAISASKCLCAAPPPCPHVVTGIIYFLLLPVFF